MNGERLLIWKEEIICRGQSIKGKEESEWQVHTVASCGH